MGLMHFGDVQKVSAYLKTVEQFGWNYSEYREAFEILICFTKLWKSRR